MKKIRVGIDGNKFSSWGGGIDFIATIAEALESTGKVETILVAGEESNLGQIWLNVRCWIKGKFSLKKAKALKKDLNMSNEEMFKSFSILSPNTKKVVFKKTENGKINNREKKQLTCLIKNNIDIILPSFSCESDNMPVPRIGYIYDFQHKYLPQLFSEEEKKRRDRAFEKQLENSLYLLVNSQSVKKDIEKFYPESSCEIIVLPFKPFQKIMTREKINLEKYHLPSKYYVICNQFWMHKSHITAFEALELLYNEGRKDIHIVCTGLLNDNRNTKFTNELTQKIEKMNCRKNIHITGFIPKDDQIAIMKGASGLIQPTLFEGGPGGGATYNAICLGLTCLLSDIPVNREINGVENVYFFEKMNSRQLAELMRIHVDDEPINEEVLNDMVERNKKEYGKFLLSKLEKIIEENQLK